MFIQAVGTIPDSVLEIGVAIVVILVLKVLARRMAERRKASGGQPIPVEGPKTGKSIMWGIAPQDFEGPVAEALGRLLDLPGENETSVPVPVPSLVELAAVSAAQTRFSTLSVTRTDEPGAWPDGIVLALRADFIRPDCAHTSQAAWMDERTHYGLDEWIDHGGRLYNAGPFWADMTDRDIAGERREVTATLQPEAWLEGIFSNMEPVSCSEMTDGGEHYLVLSMAPLEDPQTDIAGKLWFDVDGHRLRKVAIEDNTAKAAMIAVFSAYDAPGAIGPPEWLNMTSNPDGGFTITNDTICAVEHW